MVHEDDSPMTEHRSLFDTIPCQPRLTMLPAPGDGPVTNPPPSEPVWVGHGVGCFCPTCIAVAADSELRRRAHILQNPVFSLSAKGRDNLAELGVELPPGGSIEARIALVEQGLDRANATLNFPGGTIELPKPTRADLVLSAQQWATAVREMLQDRLLGGSYFEQCECDRLCGPLDRLDAVLAELART